MDTSDIARSVTVGVECVCHAVVYGSVVKVRLEWSGNPSAARRAAVLEEVAGSLADQAEVLRSWGVR